MKYIEKDLTITISEFDKWKERKKCTKEALGKTFEDGKNVGRFEISPKLIFLNSFNQTKQKKCTGYTTPNKNGKRKKK